MFGKRLTGSSIARVLGALTVLVCAQATAQAQTITPIADIQANPTSFEGQVVTVEGQVYIPTDYRVTVTSGYIQDASGRGINLFGTGADDPLLLNTGNVVRVTGTVDLFFTTVEILNLTAVSLVSSGNPPLQPAKLSTGAAANSDWEGTFIEVSGPITDRSTGGPGLNYTVNDGSGPIVVRVVDDLGATQFNVGQTITGRGAGGQFGSDFQVLVGSAADIFEGGGADTTPPTLVSAEAADVNQVDIDFSEPVTSATAQTPGNYELFETATPGNTIGLSGATLAGGGLTVSLALSSSLQESVDYTVRVNNIQDAAGNTIVPNSTVSFTYSATTITPIADIQANPNAFSGQVVTVEGQVYIPANYIGSRFSGYIQDGSDRGINVFGSGADDAALFDVTNVVRVTGTVALFFTTVEIENITEVVLVSTGNPPLSPVVLGTGAAASPAWEGTFIESGGEIQSIATTGGSAPATNYTIDDGSGPLIIRVVDDIGAASFSVGQTITGRGAGSAFGADFQLLVGRTADVFEGGGEDTTPPTLVSASATSLTQVNVQFSEAMDAFTGAQALNYAISETATPANTVTVSSASVAGNTVTLNLGASLQNGVSYTLRVQDVEDLAGNAIVGAPTTTFTPSASSATPIADIQANPGAFEGQEVTVEGQVYIPTNYIASRFSGYIQDGSARGINLFGDGANDAALFDRGNIVRVTGTVALFFSTVEIENITSVMLVSSANPPLEPTILSTGAAGNSAWEGTFIESSGEILAIGTTGGSAPATNYTINDGGGPLIIRVVDDIGAQSFSVGQTITGRGAGAAFQSDFQVLVGRSEDVFLTGGGPDVTPPQAVGATATTANQVNVSYSEAVTPATAELAGNYEVFETATPANSVPVSTVSLSANGRTATLDLGGTLNDGVNYSVRINNVQDLAGNSIAPNSTVTFLFSASGVTPIAVIQDDPEAFDGQTVTVQGQVFVPANYRAPTTSGYIQDDSGRGINIFGSGANVPIMNDITNIVRVTGDVEIFFTTIEITNISEVTLISSGNPPLLPTPLSTGAAASASWEGTFIQVTGEIRAKEVGGPGLNYTVNDDSGPIIVRVVDPLGATEFDVGQTVTARGAGGQFGDDFQVNVGRADDFFEGAPSEDILPPVLLNAIQTASTQVTLVFNETVEAISSNDASNYEVFRTNSPGTTIEVVAARFGDNNKTIVLDLAESINVQDGFTVRVRNVQDAAGNAVPAAGVSSEIQAPTIEEVTLRGPAFTFLPRQGERYAVTFTVPSRVVAGQGEILLRVFDLNGRLRKTLFDSRFEDLARAFENNRAERNWDGRDNFAELVAAGTYIVHLLVVDSQSGERKETQMPVVVATRLDR